MGHIILANKHTSKIIFIEREQTRMKKQVFTFILAIFLLVMMSACSSAKAKETTFDGHWGAVSGQPENVRSLSFKTDKTGAMTTAVSIIKNMSVTWDVKTTPFTYEVAGDSIKITFENGEVNTLTIATTEEEVKFFDAANNIVYQKNDGNETEESSDENNKSGEFEKEIVLLNNEYAKIVAYGWYEEHFNNPEQPMEIGFLVSVTNKTSNLYLAPGINAITVDGINSTAGFNIFGVSPKCTDRGVMSFLVVDQLKYTQNTHLQDVSDLMKNVKGTITISANKDASNVYDIFCGAWDFRITK